MRVRTRPSAFMGELVLDSEGVSLDEGEAAWVPVKMAEGRPAKTHSDTVLCVVQPPRCRVEPVPGVWSSTASGGSILIWSGDSCLARVERGESVAWVEERVLENRRCLSCRYEDAISYSLYEDLERCSACDEWPWTADLQGLPSRC